MTNASVKPRWETRDAAEPVGTLQPVRVLVVEDEVDLAQAVATGLRREGYAVDIANGVEQTSGDGELSIVSCGGGTPMTMPMTWDGNRWNGHLDTSAIGSPGCYNVTASLDGNAAGSFRLDLRGIAATVPKGANPKSSH